MSKIKGIIKSVFVILLLVNLLLTGCSYNEKSELKNTEMSRKSSKLSIGEALIRLNEFYAEESIKSIGDGGNIDEIFVVYETQASTKSFNQDTLLYVVNFSNNGGYAVLAADSRVENTVLVLSEIGNASPSDFYGSYTAIEDNNISNYINPQDDDCLIGGSPSDAETFILQQAAMYASAQQGTYGEFGGTNNNVGVNGDVDSWCEPTNKRLRRDTVKSSMIKTQWHQYSPYNDKVPFGQYAGCVPVAIAQIMAYNECPVNLKVGDLTVDWNKLTQSKNVSKETIDASMVANLIRYIQVSCNSLLFPQGTFTFPSEAEKFLKRHGYKNVRRTTSFDESAVFQSLEKGYPVFLAGAQNHNVFISHGWVVDGWFRLIESYDLKDITTGKIVSSETKVRHYLHCNWGNNNASWVISGIFESDSNIYNTWYRTITYTL